MLEAERSLPQGCNWLWSEDHGQAVCLLDVNRAFGAQTCRVWVPATNVIATVPLASLSPICAGGTWSPERVVSVAAAERIKQALQGELLLAPLEANVIPLPHQLRALSRVMGGGAIRYLLADEVGLGKTIEAGLVLRELKLRGLLRRVLIVAPKGLVTQWVSEMKTHFNEDFNLVLPGDIASLRRLAQATERDQDAGGVWRLFDQVIVPLDGIKPMDERKGWDQERLRAHNQERFHDLLEANWDLVIVDEAHKLSGASHLVARYRLGQGLAGAAPYLLLLSATPHSGKSDAFRRLMSLLDEQEFAPGTELSRDRVAPYVIRTEKRQAIDADGHALFQPRQTQLIAVNWSDEHQAQRRLYEQVTAYVREGYNRALSEHRNYVGFLMILMQRLVTSSTRAIRTAIENRWQALQAQTVRPADNGGSSEEDWFDLDGQEQLESLEVLPSAMLSFEQAEVRELLQLARDCEAKSPDARTELLLDLMFRLQQEESDPQLKYLIFTEFVPTQQMLAEFLADRGFSVACLNGSMDLTARQRVQDEFRAQTRVLISTDAGGEGLNLQFCHVVVNYDLPWNPMRLEQRIGRIDRIGQTEVARVFNLLLADSVEYRVQEVLEEKLATILVEFGVDKTADLLDSQEAGAEFEHVYRDALLNPEDIQARVDALLSTVREQGLQAQRSAQLLTEDQPLDPGAAARMRGHPLAQWLGRMVEAGIVADGGSVRRAGAAIVAQWPDGREQALAFEGDIGALLTQETVTDLLARRYRHAPGQQIPWFDVPGLAEGVEGYWSLWRLVVAGGAVGQSSELSVFLHQDGRLLVPSARHVWDQLLLSDLRLRPGGHEPSAEADRARGQLAKAAEQYAATAWAEMLEHWGKQRQAVREKMTRSFAAREAAIHRQGLAEVREHRLRQLGRDREVWRREFEAAQEPAALLEPVLIIGVKPLAQ